MLNNQNLVIKSNQLNAATHEYSANLYQVLLSCIAKVRKTDFEGNFLTVPQADRTVVLKVSEYQDLFGGDSTKCYKLLTDAVKKLIDDPLVIETDKGRIIINVAERAEFVEPSIVNGWSAYIIVVFTPSIMPHLVGLTENYTQYKLANIQGFSTLEAMRVWELFEQHKHTYGLEVNMAIESLRKWFSIPSNKYVGYGQFNKNVLLPCLKEIDDSGKLGDRKIVIEPKTIRGSKKVVGVTFQFPKLQENKKTKMLKEEQDKVNATVNAMFNAPGAYDE